MRGIATSANQILAAGQYSLEETYWLNKFSGELQVSTFYHDYHKPVSQGPVSDALEFKLFGDLFAGLMKIINQSDFRLHIILVSAVVVLLNKYTSNRDIIIGMPVLNQGIEAEFINTVLPLRIRYEPHMTFKGLLLQVRQTIMEATEHQNYPFESLLYQLNNSASQEGRTLFDVAILLENIHDKKYIQHVNTNVLFRFKRTDECVKGIIEYNSQMEKRIIEQIIGHFIYLLRQVLLYLDKPLAEISILSKEEQERLLYEVNDTEFEFPGDKAVHQFFEQQVENVPGNTAVVYEDHHITYNRLNLRANQLAQQLKEKGVKSDTVVGIVLGRSLDMVIGILGILKAGGVYLPIDPIYPTERIQYMMEDSGVTFLITQKGLGKNYQVREIITLAGEDDSRYTTTTGSPAKTTNSRDPLYVIYTSGSTGKPKGVLVSHKSFVNLIYYHRHLFKEGRGSRMSQVASLSFDAMAFELWPCLCSGGVLCIAANEIQVSPQLMMEWLIKNQVEFSYQPTIMAELLLEKDWPARGTALKVLMTAGDRLSQYPSPTHHFQLFNLYGPTEGTVWTTWTEVKPGSANNQLPPIGKPIGNHKVYILDTDLNLLPFGAVGELCIGGEGVANGYLNRENLTAEKFVTNPFAPNEKIYRTGDLARWLPDGQLEFIGRRDQQVKIRGFRVELGEIENRLLKHTGIKKTVVTAKEDANSVKYLCAYYVADQILKTSRLRKFLLKELPEYMIPSHFQAIDHIPLTENGKVNLKLLPEPEVNPGDEYVPPRDEVDRKLIRIWAKVLEMDEDQIGIDSDFFTIGGHSLRATMVVTIIHKTFHVKIPLVDIFRVSTIRELSGYIKTAKKDRYAPIQPAKIKEFYVLSSAQKRLYIIQKIEKDNMSYNTAECVILEGKLAREKFDVVFRKLIQRHEAFRTSIQVVRDEPLQKIHPPDEVNFSIEYFENNEEEAKKIIKNFRRPFDLSRVPLMRVGLMKVGEEKHILMIEVHHIAADGTSMGILLKEFMELYDGKELSPLRIQYKDYSEWQNNEKEKLEKQEEYWLKQFENSIPVLNVPLDAERTSIQNFQGNYITFDIGAKEAKALKELAIKEEATLFTVLLSIYYVVLAKQSGQEDIIIGTINAGRRHAELEFIIGMFVNTLALRNYPGSNKIFRDFLQEVNFNTLEAFENMDYQFEDLVEKVAIQRIPGHNPLFDVMFVLQNINISDFNIPGLTIRPYPFQTATTKFDLNMLCYEAGEELHFSLNYNAVIFKEETIHMFIRHFKSTLSFVINRPGSKISEIEIISSQEENEILSQFNIDDIEDE